MIKAEFYRKKNVRRQDNLTDIKFLPFTRTFKDEESLVAFLIKAKIGLYHGDIFIDCNESISMHMVIGAKIKVLKKKYKAAIRSKLKSQKRWKQYPNHDLAANNDFDTLIFQ